MWSDEGRDGVKHGVPDGSQAAQLPGAPGLIICIEPNQYTNAVNTAPRPPGMPPHRLLAPSYAKKKTTTNKKEKKKKRKKKKQI